MNEYESPCLTEYEGTLLQKLQHKRLLLTSILALSSLTSSLIFVILSIITAISKSLKIYEASFSWVVDRSSIILFF